MFNPGFYDEDDPMSMYASAMLRRQGLSGQRQIFDEHYRCYPVAMLPGPEREYANHGGKVFMPPSALDRLTRLHITYPMLFELINGAKERVTHAGVLEFIAEEGKIYLPFWIMQTLLLEPGDLLQIKSTDLPPGSFIKVQPQSTAFLDISDPKAVLENVMRNFSCLTKGDVFSFDYNEQIYEMAVLEAKPQTDKNAISVLETDLEVDFAPPVGYVEPTRGSGTSTPRSGGVAGSALPHGGTLHNQGTMAQAINYSSIAPSSTAAAAGGKAVSSNFLVGGQKLSKKGASKGAAAPPTPKASTPVAGASSSAPMQPAPPPRRTNGPQPLRLPPGKLFFGYEIKPLRNAEQEAESAADRQVNFAGSGQSLRGGTKRKGGDTAAQESEQAKTLENTDKGKGVGDKKTGGRTLRDVK
ncbi:MAG: Ubiquitin recognition factor in ER-associated degradation protein 1 [Sclerophora amabilis]|nr:MAG: Ubiquitin recognition factor in ER-associated degradation protein 1 [Sclerophora amabilis]